jgi:peptidoglycan glycosyltransferase
VNAPIRRLSVFALLLFLSLLGNVTYLQFFAAGSLDSHPGNSRVLDAEFSRERGQIVVNGVPVARTVPSDDQFKFQRQYPQGPEYAQLTGYFSYQYGSSGIEYTQNRVLSGEDPRLFVNNLVDLLTNTQPKGGSVSLTINPAAQSAAFEGLHALGAHTQGAVVALDPSTGAILALVSSPTYDPNRLANHNLSNATKAWDALTQDPVEPMLDRGIQTALPPGSTFKLVTAAAALSSGSFTPDTKVPGGKSLTLPETTHKLTNFDGESCGPAKITLQRALEVSCNVSYGWVGLQLGADTLRSQAEAFGWGQTYLDDLNGQVPSQFPENPDQPETAFSAIGQFDVTATPLQMAMVAAGIANHGTVMKPYLVDEVRGTDLSILDKATPSVLSLAVTPQVAHDLTQMMIGVVDKGTGTNAQIEGIQVAGKTGTAQSAPSRAPYAWFVAFAPADNPQVAVAVLVQDAGVPSSQVTGGALAAPIAREVMKAVIGR